MSDPTQDANPVAGVSLDVLLPTIGSAGDVHPIIELGIELTNRGHRATVITNEFFEQQIRDAGLDFAALGTGREAEETIADPRLWHATKSFDCIAERAIIPNIERLYRIVSERKTSRTVVAASGLCFGARIAQEKDGIPLATVHLQPALFRSLVDGGRLGRLRVDKSVPRFLKRSLFWAMDKLIIDRKLGPPLNALRVKLGLPVVGRIFQDFVHSPQLVIGLFPEWFAPVQPDWPRNTHLVGFVLHDDGHRRTVTQEVEEFLAAGPPPLLFTPGSAAATLHNFFEASVEACRMGGHRGMMVTNFPEQLPPCLPPGVKRFPYLPFSEVLPRCAALIYPGGIGTMAQAIKAGIPHLVVPHGHDQPDNALRVERMGLGIGLYPERYKGRRVNSVLQQVLKPSKDHADRFADYARRIDSATSVKRACDLIEGLGSGARKGLR